MRLITADERNGMVAACQREALHLEMRDSYHIPDEAARLASFMATGQRDHKLDSAERKQWLAMVRGLTSAGKRLRRARIVSEPVSDYIRYEWAGTHQNIAAGEEIRWLPRRLASAIALPGNDFWLIDGGAVGTFAVQLARFFGATVTAVCSTGNVATARKLGADRVIDYTTDDFVAEGTRYDLVFDGIGNRSFADRRRVLRPEGTLVFVGGPKANRLFGPLAGQAVMRLRDRRMVLFLANANRADLDTLAGLLADGAVVPEIERAYPPARAPDAMTYLATGHARGKLVISV